MNGPELSQGPVNSKLATPTSSSDVDKNSTQDEMFAEDKEVDDAGGLFGSDEEDEGPQYNATSPDSLWL